MVTLYVCDPALSPVLIRLVDEMEAEDPLEEVPDSAYDRFAETLRAQHLHAITLSEEASAPAQPFYEWFHDRVTDHLDKLYLTHAEAGTALATLNRLIHKHGMEKLVAGFRNERDDYPLETAVSYLTHVRDAMERAVQLNGLLVICYE